MDALAEEFSVSRKFMSAINISLKENNPNNDTQIKNCPNKNEAVNSMNLYQE